MLAGVIWKKSPPAPALHEDSAMGWQATQTMPSLSPQFCFTPGALGDFVRTSRAVLDDSISQNLNALSNPSGTSFLSASNSQRQPRKPTSSALPLTACASFRDRVLLPAWATRSAVLDYCASVAASPDPDDPDTQERLAEAERAKRRIVDPRLDPYSTRVYPSEPRTVRLAREVEKERTVEKIVRMRSWDVVMSRCVGTQMGWERSWEDALQKWRKSS